MDDYLRVWRALKSGNSFRETQNVTFTESFISSQREQASAVTRRAAVQIMQVMQEQVRRKKLSTLMRASSATVVFDDKGEHSLLAAYSYWVAILVVRL